MALVLLGLFLLLVLLGSIILGINLPHLSLVPPRHSPKALTLLQASLTPWF